jgi:hypothetical protein
VIVASIPNTHPIPTQFAAKQIFLEKLSFSMRLLISLMVVSFGDFPQDEIKIAIVWTPPVKAQNEIQKFSNLQSQNCVVNLSSV